MTVNFRSEYGSYISVDVRRLFKREQDTHELFSVSVLENGRGGFSMYGDLSRLTVETLRDALTKALEGRQ